MGETRQNAQHEKATMKLIIKNMQTKPFANRTDVGPKDSVITWGFRLPLFMLNSLTWTSLGCVPAAGLG